MIDINVVPGTAELKFELSVLNYHLLCTKGQIISKANFEVFI